VFGERFWPGALVALLGGGATVAAVTARLDGLIARDFVVRRASSRVAGEAEYAFRHALVRDAAYAMLPASDRAHAHRLAGEWLSAAGEADPAALAAHFERGEAPSRAAVHLRRAAQDALDGNDLRRASELAARAVACDPDPATRRALRGVQAEVSYWRGDHADAAAQAAEAAEAMEPGAAAWFESVSVAIGALGQLGRNDQVARWLERVAAAPSSPEARGAHVTTLCRGLTQLYWAHHASDLRDAHARLYALAQPFETLDPYRAGWVHRVQAEGLWLRARDVDRSLVELDASCDAYERAGARRTLCLTWINSASLHGWAGEFERSAALLARAEVEVGRLRAGFLRGYGAAVRALVGAWSGAAGAEEALRESVTAVAGNARVAYLCRVYLGSLAFERGDVAEAEAQSSAALKLDVAADLRPAAMALFARVLVARRALSQGVEVAREAVRIEHATRDVELTEAMADLALVEALEAHGDRPAALAALNAGHARLAAVASRIASPERRRRFWARRLPNDRIHTLALAWGLATDA
jgi:tetratricopeptide (TPR) repeat protein